MCGVLRFFVLVRAECVLYSAYCAFCVFGISPANSMFCDAYCVYHVVCVFYVFVNWLRGRGPLRGNVGGCMLLGGQDCPVRVWYICKRCCNRNV